MQVLGSGSLKGRVSHGRMVLVDASIAVIGSMALSEVSLGRRREVAVTIHDPAHLGLLQNLFDRFASKLSPEKLALSEFSRSDDEDDDDE